MIEIDVDKEKAKYQTELNNFVKQLGLLENQVIYHLTSWSIFSREQHKRSEN